MAAPARMEVRLRLHQLTLDWLDAVAELLQEIENTDQVLLADGVRERAARVRALMFASAVADE